MRAAFRDYWAAISDGAADAELDRWAEGSLELAFVNAGPECQLAFWRMSVDLKSELTLNGLADSRTPPPTFAAPPALRPRLRVCKRCPRRSEGCRGG